MLWEPMANQPDKVVEQEVRTILWGGGSERKRRPLGILGVLWARKRRPLSILGSIVGSKTSSFGYSGGILRSKNVIHHGFWEQVSVVSSFCGCVAHYQLPDFGFLLEQVVTNYLQRHLRRES